MEQIQLQYQREFCLGSANIVINTTGGQAMDVEGGGGMIAVTRKTLSLLLEMHCFDQKL